MYHVGAALPIFENAIGNEENLLLFQFGAVM
jgi:hypothetical protein